jgi:mRNA-degrading endonuclease RelE of RelBE toxin-antitoxin system
MLVLNSIKSIGFNRTEELNTLIARSLFSGNRYAVYKVRVKNSDNNKGQSGGYRVIYYTIALDLVLLTTIYSKSDLADIGNNEIEEIIAKHELELEEKAQEREVKDLENPSDS